MRETVHEVLYAGDMFGLIQGLFYGVPHHLSFRAKTNVYLVSLYLGDWEYLLDYFPETKSLIYMKASDIYNNI